MSLKLWLSQGKRYDLVHEAFDPFACGTWSMGPLAHGLTQCAWSDVGNMNLTSDAGSMTTCLG